MADKRMGVLVVTEGSKVESMYVVVIEDDIVYEVAPTPASSEIARYVAQICGFVEQLDAPRVVKLPVHLQEFVDTHIRALREREMPTDADASDGSHEGS